MSFEYYLKRKNLSSSSIRSYCNEAGLFQKWMNQRGITADELGYGDIMDYIRYCKNRGNCHNTICAKIHVVKRWMDYRYIRPNPCKGWHIKRRNKFLPSPLLTAVEINRIYHRFPAGDDALICHKVIVGLMCYQALDRGDILNLRSRDVHLPGATIHLRAIGKKAPRSIRIPDAQKPVLTKYLEASRTRILAGRPDTADLIVKPGGIDRLGMMTKLYDRLRCMYPDYISPKQLRASVIVNWLKDHNLREVQYMAGHRYVSSTERYLEGRMEDLQKRLDDLHPLR